VSRPLGRFGLTRADLAAALLGLLLVAVHAWPERRPANEAPLFASGFAGQVAEQALRLLYDDASYYLVIARRAAAAEGPTFDGRHATSGYHPLWLLVLVLLAGVTSGAQALVLGTLALQALLFAASSVVVLRLLRARASLPAAALGTLVWIQFACVYRQALSGLEWGLHALLLLITAALWQRDFGAGPQPAVRACARLGLVLALLFLARVDSLPLAGLLLLALAARRAPLGRLLAVALPVALAAGGYAAFNRATTGRVTPISAAVKAEWSQALLERDPIFAAHGLAAAKLRQLAWPVGRQRRAFWLPLALGTLGAAAALPWLRASLAPHWPFIVFAWVQWLALALRLHDGYSFAPWYFAVQPWLAALVTTSAAERLGAARPAWVALAGLALLAFVAADARASRARAAVEESLVTVARAVRAHVPRDARVGAWNAGHIALVSGRAVTNLDGLVNDWDFFERGRRDPCAYLRADGIAYLADSFPAGGAVAMAPGLRACAGSLRLVWSRRRDDLRPPRLDALYAVVP
jgi:hypothetical protein